MAVGLAGGEGHWWAGALGRWIDRRLLRRRLLLRQSRHRLPRLRQHHEAVPVRGQVQGAQIRAVDRDP
ncbi:hypothetical protein ACWD4N_46175, partial [Streptomyces sp. NPDC002586]